MAMSYIWSGLVILSFLWGFFHGNLSAVAAAVASVRAAFGSAAPFDILPAVWISSLASVTVGLLTARLLSRRKGGPA